MSGEIGERTSVMGAETLTPERLVELRSVTSPAVAPDGSATACVVGAPAPARAARAGAALWITTSTGAPAPTRVVDHADAVASAPCWSSDSQRLAFALARAGELAQPWIREPSGELRQLCEIDGSVESLSWAADGAHLLAVVADPGSDSQGAGAGTRMAGGQREPIVRRPGEAWRRLWRVDASAGEARPVSPPALNVWEFGWAGDGPIVAVVSDEPTESAWYDARIALIDPAVGIGRDVYQPRWQLQSPVVSNDGHHAAFVEGFSSDRVCVTGTVTVLDLATGDVQTLAPELDVAQIQWLADGRLLFAAISGLDVCCGMLDLNGGVDVRWRGPAMMGMGGPRVSASDDGRIIASAKESAGEPPELRVLAAEAETWRALTSFNEVIADLRAPVSERYAWTAADGLRIEGILMRRVDHGGDPMPLIVMIHGGPVGAHAFGFERPVETALVNAGYAVLLPNPRGSAGRGQTFAQGVRYDMGGAELEDTIAGVEALRAAGVVDGDRVGITGFSHGGFISAWAPTQTDVFRAAVPRGCVANWLSFHNTSNIGRWDELFVSSDPYDPTGHHFTRSPVVHARACRTPTLVMHGELDLSAPVGQAHELYQALVGAGCETELVIYPRAGHGWREREQVLDSCARIVAWFDRHLAA